MGWEFCLSFRACWYPLNMNLWKLWILTFLWHKGLLTKMKKIAGNWQFTWSLKSMWIEAEASRRCEHPVDLIQRRRFEIEGCSRWEYSFVLAVAGNGETSRKYAHTFPPDIYIPAHLHPIQIFIVNNFDLDFNDFNPDNKVGLCYNRLCHRWLWREVYERYMTLAQLHIWHCFWWILWVIDTSPNMQHPDLLVMSPRPRLKSSCCWVKIRIVSTTIVRGQEANLFYPRNTYWQPLPAWRSAAIGIVLSISRFNLTNCCIQSFVHCSSSCNFLSPNWFFLH